MKSGLLPNPRAGQDHLEPLQIWPLNQAVQFNVDAVVISVVMAGTNSAP